MPILNKSPYNLIHFASDQYEAHAQLNITPEPETMIRVMMVFQSLDKPINIVLQDLSTLAKQRKGFTVIEWGGQEVPKIRPI